MDIVCEVIKNGTDYYYPKTVSVRTEYSLPYNVNSADVELYSGDPIIDHFDLYDVVNIKINGIIIFNGSFEERIRKFSNVGLTTTIKCFDFGIEMLNPVSIARSYGSATATGTIIKTLIDDTCISLDSTNVTTTGSPNIAAWNIAADERDVLSAVSEIRDLSYWLYTKRDDSKKVYYSEKPSSKLSTFWIQEDSNLISIKDTYSIKNLVRESKVYGNGVSGTGTTGSPTAYGKRRHRAINTQITNANNCTAIAQKIVDYYKDPLQTYEITCIGDTIPQVGDLIELDVPTLDINAEYYINTLKHYCSNDGFILTIELGHKVLTDDELQRLQNIKIDSLFGQRI